MKPNDPALAPHLRPARRSLLVALAAGAVGGLLTVAQAFAIAAVIVSVVAEPAGSSWPGTTWRGPAAWLAAVLVARAGAALIGDVAAARAAGRVSLTLRRRLIQAAAQLPAAELSRYRTGELTVLATRGVAAVEPYLTRYLPTLALAAVLPAATTAVIFWLDWLSGVIVLCTLPLIPVFAALIGLSTRDKADRQWALLSRLSGHFLDVVRGLPTLVAYRRAGAQAGRIRRITEEYRKATVETLRIAFASSVALELIATISVALVAVAVGLRLAHGNLDFLTALTVLLLAPEAYWPLRRVGAEYHAAAEGQATFAAATALLDATELQTPGERVGHLETTTRPAPVALSVHDLSFGYPERDQMVLSDLTVEFPATGLVAITGPSGCGKSTLLALLLGELEPVAGTVIRPEPQDVAWAGQRPWLTADTIAANVRIGAPEATDEEVRRALATVDLADAVAALPRGIDTPLGDDGAGLSAGQRARVALARVVIARRPVVLLDEPSAHLDDETEQVLMRTLRSLAEDSLVVVVAHRPAVAEIADEVIALPASATDQPTQAFEASTPAVSRPAVAASAAGETPVLDGILSRFGLRTGTLLGTLSVGSGVALTATAAWLITRASEHPPVLMLMVAIVSVRMFGLARPVLRYAERLVSHDAALRLLAERRASVYDALVPLVPGRLGVRRGDVLTSVVDDVDGLVDEQLRVRQPLWTAAGVGAIATMLGLILEWRSGLVLAVASLSAWAAWSIARRSAAACEPEFVSSRGEISVQVEELLLGLRSFVGWQALAGALDRLDVTGRRLADAATSSIRGVALGHAVVLLTCGSALIALPLVIPPGAVSGPTMALIVMLPIALVDAFTPAAEAGALSVRTDAARARIEDLISAEPAVINPSRAESVDLDAPSAAMTAVAAGWGTAPAIDGLTLDLPHGGRVGLVGPSGSGKSTAAALLLRFLDPMAGAVALQDTDLRRLTLDEVRRSVGLVDDDPYLFASSVVENVRLARPDATDAQVAAALQQAHLGEWVDRLPDGLHTLIGDGFAHVSGGERARLAVARALLAEQPVLVLDEPTAHLDADTAHRITEELLGEERDRSMVWITHTEVGLDRMDKVIELA